MQLLSNGIVTEEIINYWNIAERLMSDKTNINELRAKTREESYSIFDNKYYSSNSNNDFRPFCIDLTFKQVISFFRSLSGSLYFSVNQTNKRS